MQRHYLGLDAIRFCAASLVVLYHFGYHRWLPTVSTGPAAEMFREAFSPASTFLAAGSVGVPIFFVLSGFVIAFSSFNRTAPQFIKARATRLYPTALICATITVLFIFDSTPDWPVRYLKSLALFPIGPWVDGVYWTLAVELAFYALVALTILSFGSGKIPHIAVALGVVSASYWLLRLADFATGGHFKTSFDFVESQTGSLLLVNSGCYFSLGMMIWWLRQKGPSLLPLVIGALCLAAGIVSIAATARFNMIRDGSADQLRMIVAPSIWLLSVFLIAASVYWNEALWRIAGSWQRAIKTAGLMTYPLYLVHNNVGAVVMDATHRAGPATAFFAASFSVLALAYAVTIAEKWLREQSRKSKALPANS